MSRAACGPRVVWRSENGLNVREQRLQGYHPSHRLYLAQTEALCTQCAASLTPRGTLCFSHDARSGGDIPRPYRSGLRDVAQGGVAGAAESEHQNWINAMVLVPQARLPPRPCLLQADSAPPLAHKVSLDSEPALGDAVGRHSNVKCPLWRSDTGGDVADGPVAWCIAESRNDRPLQCRT